MDLIKMERQRDRARETQTLSATPLCHLDPFILKLKKHLWTVVLLDSPPVDVLSPTNPNVALVNIISGSMLESCLLLAVPSGIVQCFTVFTL